MKSHSSPTPRELAFERKLMGLRGKLKFWQFANRELYRATQYYKNLAEQRGKLEKPAPDPFAESMKKIGAMVNPPKSRAPRAPVRRPVARGAAPPRANWWDPLAAAQQGNDPRAAEAVLRNIAQRLNERVGDVRP